MIRDGRVRRAGTPRILSGKVKKRIRIWKKNIRRGKEDLNHFQAREKCQLVEGKEPVKC